MSNISGTAGDPTAVPQTDRTAYTEGSTGGIAILGAVNDVVVTPGTEGQLLIGRVNPNGDLHAQLMNSSNAELFTVTTPGVVQGPKADNTAVGGFPVLVGISDGTNVRTWRGQTSGAANVWLASALNATDDAIRSVLSTQYLHDGTNNLTPKFFNKTTAAATTLALVAAVAAKKIRILSLFANVVGAQLFYVADSAGAPVALLADSTNKISLGASAGFVLPFNPLGWFETSAVNLAVNAVTTNAVASVFVGTYVEV